MLDDYLIQKICDQLIINQDYQGLLNLTRVSQRFHQICAPLLKHAYLQVINKILDSLHLLGTFYQGWCGYLDESVGFPAKLLQQIHEGVNQHQITLTSTYSSVDPPIETLTLDNCLNRAILTFDPHYFQSFSEQRVPFNCVIIYEKKKLVAPLPVTWWTQPTRSYSH